MWGSQCVIASPIVLLVRSVCRGAVFRFQVALLSRAILPRQMTVEELGEIVELVKSEAGGAESKYQFVDVREEEELGKARLDGAHGLWAPGSRVDTFFCMV